MVLAIAGHGQARRPTTACPASWRCSSASSSASLAGPLNGLLVTRLKLPPFIVTLGTLSIFTASRCSTPRARRSRSSRTPFLNWTGKTFSDRQRSASPPACSSMLRAVRGVRLRAAPDRLGPARLRRRRRPGGRPARRHPGQPGPAQRLRRRRRDLRHRRLDPDRPGHGGRPRTRASTPTWRASPPSSSAAPASSAAAAPSSARCSARSSSRSSTTACPLAGVDHKYRVLAIGILVIVAVAVDQWIRRVKS